MKINDHRIPRLREEIDRLDRGLLACLSRRADLAREIGQCKSSNGRPVFDPTREAEILEALCQENQGPLPDAALKMIMKAVIASCRAVQEKPSVSFLGPEGTFSHQAALECFGPEVAYEAEDSIKDVFDKVGSRKNCLGLVPVENSTEGGVGRTMDLLAETRLKIRGEHFLPVQQTLLAASKDTALLQRIYSHPQALAQCRDWLSRHAPGAAQIETSSTAQAAIRAAGEGEGAGAVGPRILAGLHGLEIAAENIQDLEVNLTRFLILGPQDQPPTGRDKTSLAVRARHVPGSLYHCLKPIAQAGLNLTRIESRPVRGRPWEYVFFLDIQGHRQDRVVRDCLADLFAAAEAVTVLGSYPRADHDYSIREAEYLTNAATRECGSDVEMEG